jgi:TonB family protein
MRRRSCFRVGLVALFIYILLAGNTSGREARDHSAGTERLTDELVSRLSDSGIRTLVVFDLTGPDSQILPFGSWIADRISNTVAGKQFRVVARSRLAEEIRNHHLVQKDAFNAATMSHISRLLGADGFVSGSFGPFKGQVGITVAIWRAPDTETTATFRFVSMVNGKMPLDSDASSHLTVPLEALEPSGGVYKAGYAGRTVAECESCPPPQFPPAALWKAKQGSIVVMVVVSADGTVIDVTVVESPDAELNAAAINAIKTYRYKPAFDPDGEPTTVRMPFTVGFKIR